MLEDSARVLEASARLLETSVKGLANARVVVV